VGGYDDWVRQSQAMDKTDLKKSKPKTAKVEAEPAVEGPRKLSYKEQKALEAQQKELAELPEKIEALEAEQMKISAKMADASFYQGDGDEITATAARLKELEEELARAYARWGELENG